MGKEITLKEHLANAARARWEGKSADERKAHARMMNAKRWGKKPNAKNVEVQSSVEEAG